MLFILFGFTVPESADLFLGILENLPVGLEEVFGDRLYAEGDVDGLADGLSPVAVVVPHVGDPLHHRALSSVPVGHYPL